MSKKLGELLDNKTDTQKQKVENNLAMLSFCQFKNLSLTENVVKVKR